jgi:hypothetical protein
MFRLLLIKLTLLFKLTKIFLVKLIRYLVQQTAILLASMLMAI